MRCGRTSAFFCPPWRGEWYQHGAIIPLLAKSSRCCSSQLNSTTSSVQFLSFKTEANDTDSNLSIGCFRLYRKNCPTMLPISTAAYCGIDPFLPFAPIIRIGLLCPHASREHRQRTRISPQSVPNFRSGQDPSFERCNPDPRRADSQSKEHKLRYPTREAHGRLGSFRFRQEFPRLRHGVRRRAEALRRISFRLRSSVSGTY